MCYSALVKRELKDLAADLDAAPLIARFDAYDHATKKDPKAFPPRADRIFPMHYAPVAHAAGGQGRVIEPMRYSAYPPPEIPHPERYTTFNARRDNLTSSFWREAFLKHHGAIVLRGFYEWVEVKDLLSAGVVTLPEVRAEFARQAEERKQRLLSAGKKHKPTPTELKDARERKIIIEFRPEDGAELYVPVIFSVNPHAPGGAVDSLGFAIVTDDPPDEIRLAGHDRCPVVLTPAALDAWMRCEGRPAAEMEGVLVERRRTTFVHALPEAA